MLFNEVDQLPICSSLADKNFPECGTKLLTVCMHNYSYALCKYLCNNPDFDIRAWIE